MCRNASLSKTRSSCARIALRSIGEIAMANLIITRELFSSNLLILMRTCRDVPFGTCLPFALLVISGDTNDRDRLFAE